MASTKIMDKNLIKDSCKRIINMKDTYDWKETIYDNDDRISANEEIENVAYYIAEVLTKFKNMDEFTQDIIDDTNSCAYNSSAFFKQKEEFNFKEMKRSKKIKLEGKRKIKSVFFNDTMKISTEKSEITLQEISDNDLSLVEVLATNITMTDKKLPEFLTLLNKIPIQKEIKITTNNLTRVNQITKIAEGELINARKVLKQIYEPILPLKKGLLNYVQDLYEDYDGNYKEVLAPYLKKAVGMYQKDIERVG